MVSQFKFEQAARIPAPGDNCAIALKDLGPATRLEVGKGSTTLLLTHAVLEGHRFAVRPIHNGEPLLSWGLPFGAALRDIPAGEAVCNEQTLEALRLRRPDLKLLTEANFSETIHPFELDEAGFRPGSQVSRRNDSQTFLGFLREDGRGVGTRNFILVLGTTSRTSSFARLLSQSVSEEASRIKDLNGVVAVGHTEGGMSETPNNRELLLRTLAGFIVHPNIAAVLAVDQGSESVGNRALVQFLESNRYPVRELPIHWLSIGGFVENALEEGTRVIRDWLRRLPFPPRRAQPLSALRVALQCGGSDAFSGISANPLAAAVAREILAGGGSANLAETDELIGAESYVLANVKDLETARRFLAVIERFKRLAAWHGHTAEGNPSGGNRYRGLYNIVLKSIGAALKKNPDVRLDQVIEYGERMSERGFYFMDSPGNDLESVAGQVASGANLIYFTTGNGSITNFPFVPTIKITTTTRRHRLLERDMDVNAGAFLDGVPMEDLTRETLKFTLEVASGRLTQGEKAGHSQVSIWRDWRQTGDQQVELLQSRMTPHGRLISSFPPLPAAQAAFWSEVTPVRVYEAFQSEFGPSVDQVGLILPTSLCAGQIAERAAQRLNGGGIGRKKVSRFVALVHTEGCGVSAGASEERYSRLMIGYLTHPMVRAALLLEHGCEKTHNDYFRGELQKRSIAGDEFGWASIQLDGGIEKVLDRVQKWFEQRLSHIPLLHRSEVGLGSLRLGLLVDGKPSPKVSEVLAVLCHGIVSAGGTVVVPDRLSPLSLGPFRRLLFDGHSIEPDLEYGAHALGPGFHVMEMSTSHWVEVLTGLGAGGVELFLGYVGDEVRQGHPLIPLIQFNEASSAADVDLSLDSVAPAACLSRLVETLTEVASGRRLAFTDLKGLVDFQVSRGPLGVSL